MVEIPSNILTEFISVSVSNVSQEDGKLVETLAFIVGERKENGVLRGTHLIFPKQDGEGHRVDDKGKTYFNMLIDIKGSCYQGTVVNSLQ